MARFRFRVSLQVDDLRFAVSLAIDDRPERRDDLAAELAAYSSPADLRDLEAVLDHHADTDTAEIRGILAGQARRRLIGP